MPEGRFYEKEFSLENFLSLAQGCVLTANKLMELHEKKDADSLIIPSRGAYPIFRGVFDALKGSELEEILSVPSFMKVKGGSEEGKFPVVPVPLTADVYIPEEKLGKYGKRLDEVVDEIRDSGSYLISLLFKDGDKRREDKCFRAFELLLEEVEGRREIADYYRQLRPLKKPVILDTLISGRAFYTILRSLEKYGVKLGEKLYGIGIVDLQGAKLKREYRGWLRQQEAKGNVFLIPVRRIMSEDRGASLLGIVGCIYPNLLLEASKAMKCPICAVTWHVLPDGENSRSREVRKRVEKYNQAFELYMKCLESAVGHVLGKTELGPLESYRKELIALLNEHKLLIPEDRPEPGLFSEWRTKDIYETGAHVIHIEFDPSLVRKFVRNLSW
ncbi:MAG: hypothetical protein J7L59_00790 [Nanoarchaeota archaeon]|nr:hypothetical protein [Nanoarchaeota archaeon]